MSEPRIHSPGDAGTARHSKGTMKQSISFAALLLALVVGACLGVRTISSFDIGYHLAYGEHALATGNLVDSSPEIYTVTPQTVTDAKELPPGCWIDETDTFRFPNANWGSQIVFALTHRLGGMIGLCILQAGIVLAIFLVATITMHRLGLSATWKSVGVLLIAMTAYERLLLRPELLGFLLLAIQLFLLLPIWQGREILSWRRIVALTLLQLLLVNLHSYWMIGAGLTVAALAGQAISTRRQHSTSDASTARASLRRRLGILLGAQLAVGFANPWTWRLVALPVQTLAFFRRHKISTGDVRAGGHPWSIIGEFLPPWESPFADMVATKIFLVVLALVLVALIVATLRKQWPVVFLLIGLTAVSMAMRRNIAPGAILLVPVALTYLAQLLGKWSLWRKLAAMPVPPVATTITVGFLAAGLVGAITTNRFYFDQRRVDRFGLGVSHINVPILAAHWLNATQPTGRLWTDYDASSNLYYFTRYADRPEQPHPRVPILTNTWAYPPNVMAEVLNDSRGQRPFGETVRKYGIEIVALRVSATATPLVVTLASDPNWSLVHLDALHAIWIRKYGPNAALAQTYAISRDSFDLSAFCEQLRRQDSEASYAFHVAGVTLQRLGWFTKAIHLLQSAVAQTPGYAEAWFELGACYAFRSQEKRGKKITSENLYVVMKDLDQARRCFQRCLALHPPKEYCDKANDFLEGVQKDIRFITQPGR